MRVEATYIEPRRYCRGCRRKRAGNQFPDTYCLKCGGIVIAQVLDTINVRPSDARRR